MEGSAEPPSAALLIRSNSLRLVMCFGPRESGRILADLVAWSQSPVDDFPLVDLLFHFGVPYLVQYRIDPAH